MTLSVVLEEPSALAAPDKRNKNNEAKTLKNCFFFILDILNKFVERIQIVGNGALNFYVLN